MKRIPPMTDMARSPEEWRGRNEPISFPGNGGNGGPRYFYGLSGSFEMPELKKLGLDDDDIRVGDMVHVHAMAVVTGVRSEDSEESGGPCCTVTYQLRYMTAEDEGEENEADEEEEKEPRRSKLYG